MNTSPKIFISKLILVGHNKNYEVSFHNGLNIIYGDSDTGKSTVLNLIDYSLGSKMVYLYDEIEMYGKHCLLEIKLNDKWYTIKRDIFEPSAFIEVYPCVIENMESFFPYEYGPNYKKEGPAGFFSDFLLDALNIPKIKVKEAPTKDDSNLVRVSFRDIFKYCYMDQDDVGDKKILNNDNPSRFVKNKQTFKFIHNLLDNQIADLEAEIQENAKQKQEVEKKYATVSSFLREIRIETYDTLDDKINSLTETVASLELEEKRINKLMRSDDNYINEVRETLSQIQTNISNIKEKITKGNYAIEQNMRLRKEYQNDIKKLEASLEIIKKLPKLNPQLLHSFECPLCHSMTHTTIQEYFTCMNEDTLGIEFKNLKSRLKSLEKLLSEQRIQSAENEQLFTSYLKEERNLRNIVDIKTHEFVSPYIQERDLIVSRKASLNEEIRKFEYLKRVRMQLDELNAEAQKIHKKIEHLKNTIEILRSSMPTPTEVVENLANYFVEFLDTVKIRNRRGIAISELNFLPVLRNRNYTEITSGGVRTILSVGFYLSLLKNSLYKPTNYPSLIMIDTISKYLGKTDTRYSSKTDSREDEAEGVKDPIKRLNLFKYLLRFHRKHSEYAQIVIVDNDIPERLQRLLRQYTVKRFSVEKREGFQKGFIDDAGSPLTLNET